MGRLKSTGFQRNLTKPGRIGASEIRRGADGKEDMLAMPSTQKLLIGVGVVSTLCLPAVPESTAAETAAVGADAVTSPVSTLALAVRVKRPARARRHVAHRVTLSPVVAAKLRAIALCESGGNPRAVGARGRFRGAYQFDRQTWASLGGRGDPAAAPMAEQTRRAASLYARGGASAWGACASA